MAKSPLIQGSSLSELLTFFATASSFGAIKEQTIAELYSYVSIKSQPAASALAQIAVNSGKKANFQ